VQVNLCKNNIGKILCTNIVSLFIISNITMGELEGDDYQPPPAPPPPSLSPPPNPLSEFATPGSKGSGLE